MEIADFTLLIIFLVLHLLFRKYLGNHQLFLYTDYFWINLIVIHLIDYWYCFSYIWLTLDLISSLFFKNKNNQDKIVFWRDFKISYYWNQCQQIIQLNASSLIAWNNFNFLIFVSLNETLFWFQYKFNFANVHLDYQQYEKLSLI